MDAGFLCQIVMTGNWKIGKAKWQKVWMGSSVL